MRGTRCGDESDLVFDMAAALPRQKPDPAGAGVRLGLPAAAGGGGAGRGVDGGRHRPEGHPILHPLRARGGRDAGGAAGDRFRAAGAQRAGCLGGAPGADAGAAGQCGRHTPSAACQRVSGGAFAGRGGHPPRHPVRDGGAGGGIRPDAGAGAVPRPAAAAGGIAPGTGPVRGVRVRIAGAGLHRAGQAGVSPVPAGGAARGRNGGQRAPGRSVEGRTLSRCPAGRAQSAPAGDAGQHHYHRGVRDAHRLRHRVRPGRAAQLSGIRGIPLFLPGIPVGQGGLAGRGTAKDPAEHRRAFDHRGAVQLLFHNRRPHDVPAGRFRGR